LIIYVQFGLLAKFLDAVGELSSESLDAEFLVLTGIEEQAVLVLDA
jgi:hypothetical protein